MKKVLLTKVLLLAAVLFTGVSFAQTVTGTVSEANGPLPGASVVVKGTSNGASTDFDGNYSLNDVPNDATLVFSYVGYATQEVAVNGQSTVNVTMASDNALDEVVLIGYGSTTIKDATGSVAAVSSEDFNRGVIQSPEQLIQGKTAGVQISEASGQPGAGIAVRIRGSNSIRSGNDPLYVVDGVPLAGGGSPGVTVGGIGSASGGNPLTFLNPNDIESISILKDASATAIYGSRGANGVIIVQTKGGRGASKGVWELSSSVSVANPASRYDLLGRNDFLEQIAAVGNNPAALNGGADTDWQDFYTRTAYSRNTDLSYSKSYTGGNVRASFAYGNNNGIVQNTDLERITGRVNATHKFLDDKLTLTGTFSLSQINKEDAPINGTAGSTGDLIGASITQNPTNPADPNVTFPGNVLNPANLLENYLGRSQSNRFLANLSASYALTDDLSAKVTVGYDATDSETTSVFGSGVLALNGTSGIGRGGYAAIDQANSLLEATVNYKKDFGNINLDIVAGYSYQEFDRNGVFANAAGFGSLPLNGISNRLIDQFGIVDNAIDGDYAVFGYGEDGSFLSRIDNANQTIETGLTLPTGFERLLPSFVASTFDNADELQSYFARANVTINDKFLITGTVRRDGSTTFGENNRYGTFPSAAFAWQLHNEDFVGDNISTLKLRLGAGVVGSQEGLSYGQFLPREIAFGGGIDNDLNVLAGGIPGSGFVGDANPDLKWEETTDYNIGLDFGFNNDRLNGTVNVYRKETRDLLLRTQLAAPSSGGTVFQNLTDGVILNQGVELSLNYDFVNTEDWGFSTSFNIAYNNNEVQDVIFSIPTGPIRGNGLTNAFAQQLASGQPLFSFFMAEFTGFDDNGNPTYTDFDGNGVGDPDADKFFIGEDAQPDFFGGLSLNARYKNFDLSTYFNGQFGFSVYNATDTAFFTKSALLIGKNVTQTVAASDENPSSTVAVSSRFLEKGDFVRLTSASLGYNWPMSGEGVFDSLRLSLTGQNLFLITGYSGLDPELSANTGSLNASAIPSTGIDYASYPRPRTFTLGVNARF